ncbi:MAG: DUF885 domain-containing protein, partial [Gammaproteobacteria bacterium]|nr:DUF885 domain-containing protein [Gammaproteobacteria bacterium]
MYRVLNMFCVLCVALVASVPAWAVSDQSSNDQATVALHKLFQTAWQREMREHPLEASADGFHEYDGNWPDVSLAAIAREHEEDIQTLRDLAAIDRSQLSSEDQVSYDLFKYRYDMSVEGYQFKDYLMPMNQLGGIQTLSTLTHTLRFENLQDYQNYVKRLQTLNVYVDQTIALLKQGVKEGMTEPQVVMERIPHQIAANVVAKPEASQFYAPFKQMPAIIPAAEQAQLRAAAKTAIADVVVPAYRKLQQYYDNDYLPHCRKTIAAEALPNGKAYYAYQVRQYTTTDMTPEQIHQLGLKKVAEIHMQMEQIFKQVGFKGSYQDFLHYLRTNPRFYYKNPQDLLEAYRAAAKNVDPHLMQYFPVWLLPRVTYGVRP